MFIRGASGAGSHPKLHTYQEGYLLPVLGADELLFSSRHKGLLRQCRDLAAIPEDDIYTRLYGRLIQQFFEFVQVLPQKPNGVLGSLLNYGLARASLVFQRFCQQRVKRITPLLKYAVFSAALLKDVGKIISQQHIILADKDGNYLNDWNPLSGSMVGQSEFYKIYQIAHRYLRIESEVTPLLAQRIIPREAFLWLSSDLAVFSDWLAALLGEEGVGGKEITWALSLIKQEDFINTLTTLDGASLELVASEETALAEAFLAWLKEKIASGELAVNTEDAGIHVVEDGVFLEKKLFKQFCDISHITANIQIVFMQFGNLMGIPKKCGSDFLHAKYFSEDNAAGVSKTSAFSGMLSQQRVGQQLREGMVLCSTDLIFLSQLPAVSQFVRAIQAKTPIFHQQPPAEQTYQHQLNMKNNPSQKG